VLGSAMPFLFFTSIFALTSFRGNQWPGTVKKASLLAVNFSIIAAWPQRGRSGLVGRSPWDFAPLFNCLLAIAWALILGPYISELREPWERAYHLQEYSDVLPESNPLGYSDAGVVHFTPDSVVKTELGAGFKVWPYRYCAAPIMVDSENTGNSSVGFWAVGMDCCDSRGSFECGGVSDDDVHSGLIAGSSVTSMASGQDCQEHFRSAVKLAAAAAGLKVAEGALLLHWVEHPFNSSAVSGWVAFCAFMFFVGVALGVAAIVRVVLLRLHELRH